MSTKRDVLATALAAERDGISVVPPCDDGTKRPLGSWKRFQTERATPSRIRQWFANGRTGLGFVCGKVSGNLELLEFEDSRVYFDYRHLARSTGLGDTLDKVEAGYLEQTPGGGVHLLYRCSEIAGNTKLARQPGPPDERGYPTVKVLCESRGEGGYVVVAPSHGRVHSSGKPYKLVRGGVQTIATISPQERRDLWQLARSFDEMPEHETPRERATVASESSGNRPGDDFNSRATWAEILEPRGWKAVFSRGETTYWSRPGKDEGISATTNYDGSGLLYCFSTSTVLEPERGYSKFSVYAILEHNADFRAAARTLGAKGYGEPKPSPSKQIYIYDTPSDISCKVPPRRAPHTINRISVEVGYAD